MTTGCTSVESLAALGYLRRSFTCYDLDQQAERSLLRTFQKFTADDVMAALEDLKATTTHWPVAAVVEAQVRKRAGRSPGRARRYGQTLTDDGWRDGMVPANEPGWDAAAAEAKRKLHAPTEAERTEAHGAIAQRRAESELQSRPKWWGSEP